MELHLPYRPQKNALNGRFLPGSTPFNKGKKWNEWMDGRKQKRVKRNLEMGRGNMNIGGWNKKKVIGIKDGKIIACFVSSSEAERKTGIIARNIRHCCEGKRKRAGGIYWFHESDYSRWNQLIIKPTETNYN